MIRINLENRTQQKLEYDYIFRKSNSLITKVHLFDLDKIQVTYN